MAWQKVEFVKGWSSMNEYYTTRLTYVVKQLLKKGLAHSSQKQLSKNLKIKSKTFFRVCGIEYKISKKIRRVKLENHDRTLDYLDVIFKDYLGWFHHVCIEGLDNNKSLDVILYDTSDDDL